MSMFGVAVPLNAVRPSDLPWIDIRRYGAVGNGSTDDAPAIQAALNEACAKGRPLYIPAGTWRIISPITRQVALPAGRDTLVIFGDGRSNSRIFHTGASGVYGLDMDMRNGSSEYSLILTGLSIDRVSGATDAGGLRVSNTSRSLIRDVYIYGFDTGVGFCLDVNYPGVSADFTLVDHVFVGGCGTGLYMDCSAGSGAYLTATDIVNSQFSLNANYDIRLRATIGYHGTIKFNNIWVQAGTGSNGISVENAVNNPHFSMVNVDATSPSHQCFTIGSSVTMAVLESVVLDGTLVNNAPSARIGLVYSNDAWLRPSGPLVGTATVNPASLTTGSVSSIGTVTVTGAALGNRVEATFSLDLEGVMLHAWVSAINTVSYQFLNFTGSTKDLASGTLSVFVTK